MNFVTIDAERIEDTHACVTKAPLPSPAVAVIDERKGCDCRCGGFDGETLSLAVYLGTRLM